jgi:ubiquinone/menaquinone biosynthesis C-methylase UbiE
MRDYLSVVYNKEKKPFSVYPDNFALYFFKRFKFKKGQKLLEVGCGRGDFLKSFQRIGLECFGCDIQKVKVEGIKIKQVDISKEKLPYGDETFDIVYHKSVIEHISSPENLMKETYRILKPGGIVVILTPDWISQMKVFYDDFTHSRPYSRTSLKDALSVYGFMKVRTESFNQLPVLWRFPSLKIISNFFNFFLSVPLARKITKLTNIKFVRWSVELMVLGYALKPVK